MTNLEKQLVNEQVSLKHDLAILQVNWQIE